LPDVPVRSDDLVLTLLGRALELLPREQAEAMAEEVGREYGATMASGLTGADVSVGQRSLRSALQAVADALTAHGFAAHADQRNNQLRIINNHCPFGDVAMEHPVICAVDRGMVKGMLGVLTGGDTEPALLQSLPQGDTFCATAV
jgi:predicted ArsR family transcriptional regulator